MNEMLENKAMRLNKKEDKLNAKEAEIQRLQKQLARFARNPNKLFLKLDMGSGKFKLSLAIFINLLLK